MCINIDIQIYVCRYMCMYMHAYLYFYVCMYNFIIFTHARMFIIFNYYCIIGMYTLLFELSPYLLYNFKNIYIN